MNKGQDWVPPIEPALARVEELLFRNFTRDQQAFLRFVARQGQVKVWDLLPSNSILLIKLEKLDPSFTVSGEEPLELLFDGGPDVIEADLLKA